MKLAIMQPYLFPYIGYFQLINSVDKFIFYDDVAFIKQGWINRNNILLNGKKYLLSVPLSNISSYALINATLVSRKPDNWQIKLLNTIRLAYGKAPYFKDIFPLIEQVINSSSDQPVSFVAKNSIKLILQQLNITTVMVESSSVYNNNDLKGEYRVIDICKKENADTYINASGGKELYTTESFKSAGINLVFIEPGLPEYKQFENDFIQGLSIMDILMFNDKNSVLKWLTNFKLKRIG